MINRFKLFESLYEATQSKASIIKKVKDAMGDVYYIPDFEEIQRPDEPEQNVHLFSTKDGHSFALNFAGNGLHSIDFWLPSSKKPESTLYMNDQSSNIDDVIKMLPVILKDPKPKEVKIEEKIVLEKPAKDTVTSVDKSVDKLEKNLYQYGDPKTIFKDFRRYVNMVIDGTQPALLVTGSAGVGKTSTVRKEIEKAGLTKGKDWVKIKGKSTPAAVYISLYKNNGKLLIYDDCDSVLKDPNAVEILKGALDSEQSERDINWEIAGNIKDPVTGASIPKTFNFNGRVIFLSNLPQKKVDKAIKSRAFVLEVALSPDDMVKYVEELLPKMMPEIPMATKEIAMNTIKSVAKTNKDVQLNMRTVAKAIKILNEVDDLGDAKRMIVQQCSYE